MHHYLNNSEHKCMMLGILKQTEITKWQKYSQNTSIFISYEWVDHI